jgi:hypothetical protein
VDVCVPITLRTCHSLIAPFALLLSLINPVCIQERSVSVCVEVGQCGEM